MNGPKNRDDTAERSRAVGWKTVHVFVSSTFSDMHGERDYLVKEVFPELRDWCEERKLRLVDIDLRWGVSEADATHNQRVVEVCLQNIDRCRPFFLCFLGQRYGWIPGLGDVSAETLARYPGLAAAIEDSRSVTELEVLHAVVAPFVGGEAKLAADQSFFYLREPGYLADMPAKPAQLRRIYTDEAEEDAQSRAFLVDRQNKLRAAVSAQKARPVRSYSARWSSDRRTPELIMPLDCPATLKENKERWRRDWQRSGEVTVPEGALSVPAAQAEKARAYNRRLCAGRLQELLCEGEGGTHIGLGRAIQADLQAAIAARFPEHREVTGQTELDREIELHEEFVSVATRGFVARCGDFDALDAYADGDERRLFVLAAPGGMGKSTLLANWVAKRREKHREGGEIVCCRFIGVGDRSISVDSLLRYLLQELASLGRLSKEIPDDPNKLWVAPTTLSNLAQRLRASRARPSNEIPDNPHKLGAALAELLADCTAKGKTILVIDALNQLRNGLADLDWLPRTLPKNVKLVVSFTLGDEMTDELANRWRSSRELIVSTVQPFDSLDDRKAVVREYLKEYLKELDHQHLEAIVSSPGGRYPLYLKVVLNELRVFGAFAQLGQVIQDTFGANPINAFEAVLARLERDTAESIVPLCDGVPLLFGLLAHSNAGLSEEALVSIFLRELELPETHRDVVRATVQLLLRQVRPFLARREGRTDFFYQGFQTAARWRYTGENGRPSSGWHAVLARFCGQWAELTGSAKRYALRNLPSHLVAAGNAQLAAETMTDFGYHYDRLKALGREEVMNATVDFGLVDAAGSLVPTVRGRLGAWKAFYAENAHLLRREGLLPQISLLQLAAAHADSPVSESAERWLEHVGSEAQWVRSLTRPRERGECVRTLDGHLGSVEAVAALPDGKRALSGSVDHTLKLWDLATGQCLHTLEGHSANVVFDFLDVFDGVPVVALPDGKHAISGSPDYSLKLWDFEAGQCLRTFRGHNKWVTAVEVLSDGKRAISASRDKTVKLWDLETGKCLRTLKGHTDWVWTVAVLPDSKRALSGSLDGTLKLWNLETGCCLREWHAGQVKTLAVLPDGKRALLGRADNTIALWNLEPGQCRRPPEGHTESVFAVAVSPDGRHAISGSRDKTVKLWDIGSGQCLRTHQGHAGPVTGVAFLPNGKCAVSGSKDKTLKLWDLETGQCLSTYDGHTREVYSVAVLPDGKHVVSGSDGTTLRLWHLETGRCRCMFAGHTAAVSALATLPDGRRAISAGDKTPKLWDLGSEQCLRTLYGHDGGVHAVAVLPDGKRAVTGGLDATIRLWELETGHRVTTHELPPPERMFAKPYSVELETADCVRTLRGHTESVLAVAVLPDGKRAISVSRDKTLKVWNLETGLCLATWQAAGGVCCCAAGPETIVVGTETGDVLFLTLMPPGRIVPATIAATWHPAHPVLAVARANGTLLIQAWHAESQHLEDVARTTGTTIARLQWSADGAHLLTTAPDGATHILDATILQPASASGDWAPSSLASPDGRWRAVIEAGQLRIVPATEA